MKFKKLWILAILIFPVFFISCDDSDDSDPEDPDQPDSYTVTEIGTGAFLNGANGLDVGPDGNLYIASVIGINITVMDKENGTISDRLGQEMQVQGPDDLVFGPDGSMYWTNIITGEVGRMTPDGTVTTQFVAPGVNPIQFNEDGRLFVALCFLGDGLYELDPNLVEPPRPIIVATEANPFPLGFLNAFDFGPDGRIYGPLYAAGLVISVDVDRTGDPASDPFADGSVQVVSGGFSIPVAAQFDPEGKLTLLDQARGEVFKIDVMTGASTLFTTLDPGLDNLAFDEDGSLYLTSAEQGWVGELLPTGALRTISPGGLIAPQGLAFLEGAGDEDKLFVADQYNIRQLNSNSGEVENSYRSLLVPGVPEVGVATLNTVGSLQADGENLISASWFAGTVQVWNPQDGVTESYDMSTAEALGAPIDALRLNGEIIVSDVGIGGVVRASDKSVILPIDNATVFAPSGLATDGETLWVADWGTGIVWQIGFDGNTPTSPVPVAQDLVFPEGLAYDNAGGLLVVETGAARLSRIDLATGEVTEIAGGLEFFGRPGVEGTPPMWGFEGVTVAPSGDIYVTGQGNNIIYRITKD
ncbi:hypothetical protein [Robiginitalea sp.]|uniref:Vgb family protein n=1 Tax=Robiginitalea sp. TaxID=1902411 RepID=UPI003C74CD03